METIYHSNDWDCYAAQHLSVTTCFQSELYRATADLMSGKVADFGCGSAKMAAYLQCNPCVTEYIGFDASIDMVKMARSLIDSLNKPGFNVEHRKIEEINNGHFDSALSINSFYAWHEPKKVLAAIASRLTPGATFVLATPGPNLDMVALLKESRKDLIAHPYFTKFEQQNLRLAEKSKSQFITLDQVVTLAKSVGFELVSAHQHYFLSGLIFLHLQKIAP